MRFAWHLSALMIITICFLLTSAALVCAAVSNPCAEDINKFCANTQSSGVSEGECLARHEPQLSDACREHQASSAGARARKQESVRQLRAMREACKHDVATYCSKAEPGGIERCLKSHRAELSPACREGVDSGR